MSKEPTTPASGSDGLETAKQNLWALLTEEHLRGPQAIPGLGLVSWDDLRAIQAALVTREAAEKRIGGLNAEVERWKSAYDIAHDQATANGSQVAALKAALEQIASGYRMDAAEMQIAARQALALKEGR